MQSKHIAEFIVVASLLGAAAACGGAEKEPLKMEPERPPPPPPPAPETPPNECLNEEGDIRQCDREEDCCDGYTCGMDPELSRVIKYCIPY